MVDLRGNLVVGVVVALAGAAVVRSMKQPAATVSRRRWIPMIALITGPLLTVGSCVVDIYCVSEYTHPDDIAPMFIACAVIGLVAGAIGAAAFWIVER